MQVPSQKASQTEHNSKDRKTCCKGKEPSLARECRHAEKRDADRHAGFGHVELIVLCVENIIHSLELLGLHLDTSLLVVIPFDLDLISCDLLVELCMRVGRHARRHIALQLELIKHRFGKTL